MDYKKYLNIMGIAAASSMCMVGTLLPMSAMAWTIPQEVELALQSRGKEATIPIIVELKLASPYQLVGTLSAGQIAAQNAAIQTVQDNFVTALRDIANTAGRSGEKIGEVTYYTYTPYIALQIKKWAWEAITDPANKNRLDQYIMSVMLDKYDDPSKVAATQLPVIGANGVHQDGFQGRNTTIAILDSGVSHPDLKDKLREDACFSSNNQEEGSTSLCPGGEEEVFGPGVAEDCDVSIQGCGHGTHVAGIVAATAPQTNLIPLQVFSYFEQNCDGFSAPCVHTFQSDQKRALEYVIRLKLEFGVDIDAVNMSLNGGDEQKEYCNEDPRAKEVENLRSLGIPTFMSAGNSNYLNGVEAPSCIEAAIPVGAIENDGDFAPFSNRSPLIQVWAPGVKVESYAPNSSYYRVKSGTSQASAMTAGSYALLKSAYAGHPNGNMNTLLAMLKSQTPLSVRKYFPPPAVTLDKPVILKLAGNGSDRIMSIAKNEADDLLYIAGTTDSTDIPLLDGAFDVTPNGRKDGFICLYKTGMETMQCTYFGDRSDDTITKVQVDSQGNVIVMGESRSYDFPVQNAYLSQGRAFVAKFDATLTQLKYSTFIGNEGEPTDLVVDKSDHVVITGETGSSSFFSGSKYNGGNSDGFMIELNSAGGLVANNYLGTKGDDGIESAEMDKDDNLHFGGYTTDTGSSLGVVGKLHALHDTTAFFDGDILDVSTDEMNNTYIFGTTHSSDFQATSTFHDFKQNASNAFVAKLAHDTGEMLFATYVGEVHPAAQGRIQLDGAGNIYVTSLFLTDANEQPKIMKLTNGGDRIIFDKVFGKDIGTWIYDMTVTPSGSIHIGGQTNDPEFGTTSNVRKNTRDGIVGSDDGFVITWIPTSYPVTVTPSVGGVVTSEPGNINCATTEQDCSASYDNGSQVVLTAKPKPGYYLDKWLGDCSGTQPTTIITVDAAKNCQATFEKLPIFALTVTKAVGGSVSSADDAINCGDTCQTELESGQTATLTAKPELGYSFDKWSGDCGDSNEPAITVTMDTAKSCRASFIEELPPPPPAFSLTVTKTPGGNVYSTNGNYISCGDDCQEEFDAPKTVTMTVANLSGYAFVKWTGDCTGDNQIMTVNVDAAKTCTAHFEQEENLIVRKGDGASGNINGQLYGQEGWAFKCTLNCDARSYNFPLGSEIILFASPKPGAIFGGWQCSNGATHPNKRWRMVLDEPMNCTAQFDFDTTQPKLTVNILGGTGKGDNVLRIANILCNQPVCAGHFEAGKAIALSVEEEGSRFLRWSGDCAPAGSNKHWPITPNEDMVCNAHFEDEYAKKARTMVDRLYEGNQSFAETFPRRTNEACLQTAFEYAISPMEHASRHSFVTEGAWPHQFNGIEWFDPIPDGNCTQSVQIVDSAIQLIVSIVDKDGNERSERLRIGARREKDGGGWFWSTMVFTPWWVTW